MGSRERTLLIVGVEGAGKATLTGCMLFKYGGIDMFTMQRFQEEGIRTYDKAARDLKSLGVNPEFDTPKHHVTILGDSAGAADCAIFVLAANSSPPMESLRIIVNHAKKIIVVVNKMDEIDWSESGFREVVDGLQLGEESIPIIPTSALSGDNLVEKSPKSSWYEGWKRGSGQRGGTLLEALEASFQK